VKTTDKGIRLEGVTFSYAEHHPTMHFDLNVPAGRLAAVMGPSGSGKSTLFSLICGFESPVDGMIRLDGQEMTSASPAVRPVSLMFQNNNLFAHLNVNDNVGLGLSPSLNLNAVMREKRDEALHATGLHGLGQRLPSQLSGGQRQRVALARMLVRDRPILLLDEAFASLGPRLRTEMLTLVRQLHDKRTLTTLMITHDPDDARRIADDVLVIDNGTIAAQLSVHDALSGSKPHPALANYLHL